MQHQTHNIALAGPAADFVVSLGQDGRILCQGTLSEALKSNKALRKEVKAEEPRAVKTDEVIDDATPEIPEGKGGKLIAKEELAVGHVSWSASKSGRSLLCSGEADLLCSPNVHRRDGWILSRALLGCRSWVLVP